MEVSRHVGEDTEPATCTRPRVVESSRVAGNVYGNCFSMYS